MGAGGEETRGQHDIWDCDDESEDTGEDQEVDFGRRDIDDVTIEPGSDCEKKLVSEKRK